MTELTLSFWLDLPHRGAREFRAFSPAAERSSALNIHTEGTIAPGPVEQRSASIATEILVAARESILAGSNPVGRLNGKEISAESTSPVCGEMLPITFQGRCID